jgi:hypothetical protein
MFSFFISVSKIILDHLEDPPPKKVKNQFNQAPHFCINELCGSPFFLFNFLINENVNFLNINNNNVIFFDQSQFFWT